MLEIRTCTVAEIETAPNIDAVLAEYGRESAIEGLAEPAAQFPIYRQIEAAGILHLVGAFKGLEVVGFLLFVVSVLPHYGVRAAVSESFFVVASERKTGAGTNLRRAAEALSQELGAAGLLISAPVGGVLEKVLPGQGYRQTNSVFFKGFA